jgi:hypothetical protein
VKRLRQIQGAGAVSALLLCAWRPRDMNFRRGFRCVRLGLLSAVVLVMCGSLPESVHAAPTSAVRWSAWGTDGIVDAVLPVGTVLYVGGLFSDIGPYTGGGAAVGRRTGLPVARLPVVDGEHNGETENGEVLATVSDHHGGYYIGGAFSMIGGVARRDLAHIKADGSVDRSWNASANGFVTALAASGSTVYVGGWFTSIGGHRRRYLAALSRRTGQVTGWNPGANGYVESLALSGQTVYAGGYFTRMGGKARGHIAALDARTGRVSAWNPSASGKVASYTGVSALAVSGSTVYAGGLFSSIGGRRRSYLAALDMRTGRARP